MRIWILFLVCIACQFLPFKCLDGNEEPHGYTISFFQFDPKDIGVGDRPKKESKKDIKPSDLDKLSELDNDTVADSNNTRSNLTATESYSNETVHNRNDTAITQVKHQRTGKNVTEVETLNSPDTHYNQVDHGRNGSEYLPQKYQETRKNATGDEKSKGQEKLYSTLTNNTLSNNPLQNQTDTFKNRTAQINATSSDNTLQNQTDTFKNRTAQINATSSDNKTVIEKRSKVPRPKQERAHKKDSLNPNPSPSQIEAAMHLNAPQFQGSPTEKRNNTKMEENLLFEANKTTVAKKNDTKSVSFNTVTLQKNGKDPEAEKEKLHQLTESEAGKHGDDKKNTTMESKESSAGRNTSKNDVNDDYKAKLAKLEKDKKTNAQIQKNSKKIVPVKNSVDDKKRPSNFDGTMNSTRESKESSLVQNYTTEGKDSSTTKLLKKNSTSFNQSTSNPVKGSKKAFVGKMQHRMRGQKLKTIRQGEMRNRIHPSNPAYTEVDEYTKAQIARHRAQVSHFIPVYQVSPRDRSLSFQRGSLQHPKHDIYPKCHQCPRNSTYPQCVKKSTLLSCNKDLSNICFTRSSKRNGMITYQMGCADHKKCSTAKAFPCKDGSRNCFTCCQFDRCNSSPHHGDFELDSLNMDELSLDTSEATNIKANWLYHLCAILINALVIKILL